METISIVGAGYVGLVTGVCLSEFGMRIKCVDIDTKKINMLKKGKIPIYEPDLESLLRKNLSAGRITFTADIAEAVVSSETIFIAVGTPPFEDGSADLKHVMAAAESIAENMTGYRVIVSKSTVPVGTCRKIRQSVSGILARRGIDTAFDIVSNPEFLREGSAVKDFMHPDRIIIGTESEHARKTLKDIYNVLYLIDTPFVFTNTETAELIKYASNAFLATKIAFINEIANLCDNIGADVYDVARAMGLDARIGKHYLHPGPGYGGSCLPKDTRALVRMGSEFGSSMGIVDAVVKSNESQPERMVRKIEKALDRLDGRVIAILGLSFKPETDDIRDAPSVRIISMLLDRGAVIRAYDPVVGSSSYAKSLRDRITFCTDEYDATKGADAIAILTEWNRFRHLDLDLLGTAMKNRNFFDLRNVYDRKLLEDKGYYYAGVGR